MANLFGWFMMLMLNGYILYKGAAAGDKAVLKQIWLARKKVYFFTVFSNEFSDDLSPLSKVVDIEYGMNTCTYVKYTLVLEHHRSFIPSTLVTCWN